MNVLTSHLVCSEGGWWEVGSWTVSRGVNGQLTNADRFKVHNDSSGSAQSIVSPAALQHCSTAAIWWSHLVMGGHLAPVLVQGVCSMDTAARERRGRSELFSSTRKYLDIYPQGKLQFCALEMIRQSLSCPIPGITVHCVPHRAGGWQMTIPSVGIFQ